MQAFFNLYYANKTYFRCFFLYFIALTLVTFCFSKQSSFLFINSMHNTVFDYLFSAFSFAGDGYFILLMTVVLFVLKKRPLSIALLCTYVFSGLVCSFLKRSFKASRPAGFFDDAVLHHVSWLPNAYHNAFPSGHTTSVFAAATIIAFFSGNKYVSAGCLLMAVLTGYSRIYLGQHFVEDIWLGSMLGFSSGVCYCIVVFQKSLHKQPQVSLLRNGSTV